MKQLSLVVLFLAVPLNAGATKQSKSGLRTFRNELPHISADREEIIDIDEKVKVLKMLSVKSHAQSEAFASWRGSYRFEDSTRLAGDASVGADTIVPDRGGTDAVEKIRVTRGEFRFALTSPKPGGSLASDMVVVDSILRNVSDGTEVVEDTALLELSSIITPEQYLHFQSGVKHGRIDGIQYTSVGGKLVGPQRHPAFGRMAFRDPVMASANQEWGVIFDPRVLFNMTLQPVWMDCDNLVRSLEVCKAGSSALPNAEHIPETLKARSSDAILALFCNCVRVFATRHEEVCQFELLVSLVSGREDSADYTAACTFDSRVDYLPIQFMEERGGRPVRSMDWNYKLIDDVFIPETVMKLILTKDGDSIKFQRRLTLLSCSLNDELPQEDFSFQRFALQDGDRVLDRVENVAYVYRNGMLTSGVELGTAAERPDFPLVESVGPRDYGYVVGIVVVNVIVALIVVGIIWRRRRVV